MNLGQLYDMGLDIKLKPSPSLDKALVEVGKASTAVKVLAVGFGLVGVSIVGAALITRKKKG